MSHNVRSTQSDSHLKWISACARSSCVSQASGSREMLISLDNIGIKDIANEVFKGRTTTIATVGINDISWSSELNIELRTSVTGLELDLDGLVHCASFL